MMLMVIIVPYISIENIIILLTKFYAIVMNIVVFVKLHAFAFGTFNLTFEDKVELIFYVTISAVINILILFKYSLK